MRYGNPYQLYEQLRISKYFTKRNDLLKCIMSFEITADLLKKECQVLYDQKFDFVRALYQETEGSTLAVNLKQTMVEPIPKKKGVVLSVYHKGLMYESSCVVSTLPAFQKIIQNFAERIQKSSAASIQRNRQLIEEEKITKKFTEKSVEKNEELPFETIHKKAKEITQKIKDLDSSVVFAQTRFKHHKTKEIYVSQQKSLSQEFSRFEAIFIAILNDPASKKNIQIYDGYALLGGWENMEPPQELLNKMLADGKKILTATRIEPGYYDCIFSPNMAGILAHEAFGHGTEADTMVKKRAKGLDYLNKPVASEKVHLYDSPALENIAGSYFFDHEGELAATTKIIENGILKRPITDHLSATQLQVKRSPNGRRESFEKKAYSRMTNTYFLSGEDKLEAMIASIKNGYFIDRATNGMEDPKGWGIQLEALYAEKITNGKLTGEVFSPIIVTGYVPEILTSIDMVSTDFEINGLGMCGKGHKEWVKVTDGGPFLKLKARIA